MGKFVDLTGQKFGRWTVLLRADNDKRGEVCWFCQCECGTKSIIRSSSLTTGNSRSCGCLARETASRINTKHGHSSERLYGIWEGIKSRCYDKNCRIYPHYGGRGIKMYDEWKDDFAIFYAWAQKNGYEDTLTIERVDVNGDYQPNNCIWIPKSEQSKNRRNLVIVEINGIRHHLAEWARIFQIRLNVVIARMQLGWTAEEALFTPVGKKGEHTKRVKFPPSWVFQQPIHD